MSVSRGDITPRSAVVVGAGVVGLSTAWFLQDRGVHVTVVERDEVGSGASWGNAGYLSPALAVPLTSPHVLGEGLRGLADRGAPLSIPFRADPRLWAFLLRFAAFALLVESSQTTNTKLREVASLLADGTLAPPRRS